ncbi:hypothetical protein A0J61_11806, partial [Choanephora cucurbitarum]
MKVVIAYTGYTNVDSESEENSTKKQECPFINLINKMYSSYQQPAFDLSPSSHLSTPSADVQLDRCLSFQRHDSIDYSRRPSYFTGLLTTSQSDA